MRWGSLGDPWRPGADGPGAGGHPGADRPRHQRAGLVLFLDAALDAGGLRRQRSSDEDLGDSPTSAASGMSATPSRRSMPAPDVDAIRATARRDGDHYVPERREVARHQRQPCRPSSSSRPSSSTARTPAAIACSSSTWIRRASTLRAHAGLQPQLSPRITRSTASTMCACPRPTASARKATAWASPTAGSATSG